MKKNLLQVIFSFLLVLIGVISSTTSKAQISDSILFDYDSYTSCFACGDNLSYNVAGTRDSFTDNTTARYKVNTMKVKIKIFTCHTNTPLTLKLNGNSVGTINSKSNCSCNACDSLIYNISEADIKAYYNYGGKNIVSLTSTVTGGLYIDRTIIYLTRTSTYQYDAGITGVDSPAVRVCAGTKNIIVRTRNYGKKSFTGIKLNWRWNGILQSQVYDSTSTLDTIGGAGKNTLSLKLGSKTFSTGKTDTLIAWCSSPGGQTDSAFYNDTIKYYFYGGFHDTITVGGTSPDFTTIQDAINALTQQGVCGKTFVSIRPGTYNEQLSIGTIPGTSSTNTITFLSSNNDSSSVVINFSSNSTNNFTVRLLNSAFITFNKITIEALNSTYGIALSLSGSVRSETFNNCHFIGISTTSTGSNYFVVNRATILSQDISADLNFNQCRFSNGSRGLYLANSSSSYLNGWSVTKCLFENNYLYNIYCQYAKNVNISQNQMERNNTSSSSGYGIYLTNTTDSLRISRNKIYQYNGSQGCIYIYGATGTSSKRNLIANNFLSSLTNNSSSYVLRVEYSTYTDIVFNNIYHSTSNTSAYAMYLYEGSNQRLLYNNIVNANKGVPFLIFSTNNNSISLSNRNNFFNFGGILGTFYNSSINGISDLKAIKQDSNSVSVNPFYTSAIDLHTYQADLNGRARPHAGVGTDIDGQTRNSSTPDIGADEFNLANLDAGISEFTRVLSGTQCLKVVLKNQGNTTLTSAKIDWKLNGVSKSQINWTGSIATSDTDIVCLGNVTLKDTIYNLKVWSSAPNGGTDSIASNDTLSIQFYPSMRGVYTIGGTSPDYSNFANAVSALKRRGIIDSVHFKVRNGTYTEQLEITNISGAQRFNSIIFESEALDSSLVTLQYNSGTSSLNHVVWLNGAVGVTFRKLTLKNNSATYRRLINVTGASKLIRLQNNYFQNSDSTTSSSNTFLIYFNNNGGQEIEIKNNHFNKGSYGLRFNSNSSFRDKNITITGNLFRNQGYTGVYIYAPHNFNFSNNTISIINNTAYQGFYSYYTFGTATISNNKININGINARYAMYLDQHSSTDSMRVFNNFITIGGPGNGMGLYAYYLQPALIQHNNILNECTDSANYSSSIYIYGGDYVLNNNNLTHTGNGYLYYIDYTYSLSANYNNLHSNGTKFVYLYGNSYSNLVDYTTSENLDTSSISVDPQYTSSTDLHTSSVMINGKGMPIGKINQDIDGEPRNSSIPDIGADEFTPATLDAGIYQLISPPSLFNADTIEIIVAVVNYGIDTINSVIVHAKINKDTLARKLFNRTIASGDTIHVSLGNYIFKRDSIYNILSWSNLPNNTTDQKKSNDTLRILNKRPAMTGIYTIGGSAPNFPNFKTAIKALVNSGMIDSVRFKVRPGTYTEQLLIPPINGAFNRNSIVFESQNQDTTSVTLQYNSTKSDTNYVVRLMGADGITFRNLKVKAFSTNNNNRVFDILQNAENITLTNNIIEGTNTSYGSEINALVYSGQGANHNLHIKNNHIKAGDFGIYVYGYNSQPPYGYLNDLEIIGNKILNPFYYGVYGYYLDSVIFKNNYVFMNKYSSSYNVYFERMDQFNISNNTLVFPVSYIGLYISNSGNSANYERNLISNNTLYSKNTSNNSYGFYFTTLYKTDIVYNSLKLENTYSSSSYAMYLNGGNKNNLYNNIITHFGSGYSLYINQNTTLDSSNNNNLYTKGSILGYYTGTNASNLSTWQSITGKDKMSISVDPTFKGISNLHVKEVRLNAAGKPFSRVALDMDLEVRDSLTPDIGADEFQLPPNDAGISEILLPKRPFLPDSQYVKVAIKNYGGNTLYVADIHWKLNGVTQPTHAWSDTVASGDTMHVILGKRFFKRDTLYSMIAWSSQPNGTGDSIPSNDTSRVNNVYPALSGVYTIGGATPDFNTFTDAVNAMKRGGISDSVRFDVRNGTYFEQVSIPYIFGANKANSIIFQSEQKDSSKVWLTFTPTSAKPYIIQLDSTSGITIRHMTLKTTGSTSYNRCIEILGGVKNIKIHDCGLIGRRANSTSSLDAMIYQTNSVSSEPSALDVSIYNNRFINGGIGVYFDYGYSNLGNADGYKILNNVFEDQYYMGIYMQYVNNFTIKNNQIFRNITGYSNSYGIYAQYSTKGFEISGNNLYNQEYVGVYLYECDGLSNDSGLIFNNMVHCRSNNSVSGFIIYYPNYLNFSYNNVHVQSTNTSAEATLVYSPSQSLMYNNNFVNSGSGYAMYLEGSLTRSNNNNFFTKGTNLAYRSGSNLTSLAAWKSNTGLDANSISVDPDYVSTTDLHVRNTDLNSKGRPMKYLTRFDIDGALRDTLTPDIGADEFSIPAANDAGVSAYIGPVSPFAAGLNKVKIRVKNNGYDSLKSATVNWSVNGVGQTPRNWTGKLKTGLTDTFTVGSYNFSSGKAHTLVFWTTNPNGVADTINFNDTFTKTNVYPALDGVYTVGGSLPDYTDINGAIQALSLGGVIDSVWFKIRSGTYSNNVTISPYPGSHPKRPVYFESQTGDSSDVILRSVSSNPIFTITGADYLKFNKMTFEFTGSSAMGLRISGISKGIGVKNCRFRPTGSFGGYGVYSSSDADDSTTIEQNLFENNYYGIYLYGSGTGSNTEKEAIIKNNLVLNPYYYGIILEYMDGPKITGNTITSSRNNGYPLLYIRNSSNQLVVAYNKIHHTAINYSYGITLESHTGSSSLRANIYNNFISIAGGNSTHYGLNISSVNYVNIYFNSINVYGSGSNTRNISINSGNNLDMRNNIFCNLAGGYAQYLTSSATFTQANYNDIYTTGTNLGHLNGTNYTTLAAWKSATTKEANSVSLDPAFTSSTDLHSNLISLDSACLPIAGFTDDIDRESRNAFRPDIGADEFTSLPENLGVSQVISPANSCGLDSNSVTLKIFNFGNKPQVNYPLRYRINGGSIISVTITDTLKPAKERNYTFSSKIALAKNTPYTIQAWTDLSGEKYRKNDSTKVTFTNYSTPDSVKSIAPGSGATNIDYPFSLSWVPSNGATRYDIYLWKVTDSKPTSPNVSNTTQISYQIGSGLEYGQKYNWQVIAKNPVCSTPGVVGEFTMRFLPDLVIESVSSPKSAFSSTQISVSWKVKNTGNGAASGTWYDYIYLSNDAVYDVTDVYLGGIQNPSGLNPSQNYNQSHSVTLPNGISGNYYIFVVADRSTYLAEVDNNNNSGRDTGKMFVTLTPPPDLVVLSVTRPTKAFSGSPANLTFSVKNKGTGPTRNGYWIDRIFLSTEKVVNNTSVNLKSISRTSDLGADSTYTISTSVNIPNFISGKYFFVVQTDVDNREYEHAAESNNVTGSDTIEVILTPPPDVIVENLVTQDTASNFEYIPVSYDILNDGGTATGGGFWDQMWLCPTSTFDKTISHNVSSHVHGNIDSKDTSPVSKNFRVTNGISGTYYLFIVTDYYNQINESNKENNNVSGGYKIIIQSPDLIVSRVIVNAVDSTGSVTDIKYTIKNQGTGDDYQGARGDSIFISKSSTWARSQAIVIGNNRYTPGSLMAGDTALYVKKVIIPNGYNGNYYFYVLADNQANEVFENSKDNNNIGKSNLMNIALSPYPDLIPAIGAWPDSADAGQLISLDYKIINQGNAAAMPNWFDRVYVSKDSTLAVRWDSVKRVSKLMVKIGNTYSDAGNKAQLLSSYTRTSALNTSSNYSNTIHFNLPNNMSMGNYYYYIWTDADRTVYEHANDTNNLKRTDKVFIDGYPPVDLRVNCPDLTETLNSGSTYSLLYSVTNIGDAKTTVNAWGDGIYLSTDSVFGTSDILLASVTVNKPLEKDSTYSMKYALKIPNGLSGNYYILVRADREKLIMDDDTTNNWKPICKSTGGAKLITINLTPPSDLQITAWDVPTTATSGQPMKVKLTVENKGSGATVSGNWNDQIYLSTDYIVDGTDIFLGEKQHSGNLSVNGSYSDSINVTIPINKVGNFIVLIRTDGSNLEYEHFNEGNNLVSSITTASKAPPADLIISVINSPDSVISGKAVDIDWKIKNKGSNPASGYLRDNIYLSKDSVQDGEDLLLGSSYYYISLTPNSEIARNMNVLVSGIALGDYNVLVTTDVMNNINEANDTNNTEIAPNKLNVNVPILHIGVTTPDTLSDGENIYHRIIIPDTLAGESMIITLKADSINGDNQIYVRFGEVASGSEFDYKYRDPFTGNQEIIIPELFEGTYYLLTSGNVNPGNVQNITLHARIMPFEIRKVTPKVGGNTGEVTVLIEGSKLDNTTKYYLLDSMPNIAPVDIGEKTGKGGIGVKPRQIIALDPTQAFVTFDLNGFDTGFYNVVAVKNDQVATLVKGFQIVQGNAGNLNVSITRPGNMRTGNIASMKILFNNDGNIDLINHKIIITSNTGAPIAFTAEDLVKGYSSLEIIVEEPGGPENRLRPGGSGGVDIYTKATNALGFTIVK